MRHRFAKVWSMGIVILFLLVIKGHAQQDFVYTHDNLWISGFSVTPNGSLTQVPGSPYPTGWIGSRSDFFSVNRIIVAGNFLYASDGLTSLIRGYSIHPATGSLTQVTVINLESSSTNGISLAVTPDSQFLFAVNAQLGTVSILRIGNDGSLTNTAFSPVSTGGSSAGIKVTPDGRFLAISLPFSHGLAMFRIAPDGSLSPVSGSPFTTSGLDSGPASIEINCNSSFLFVGQASILPLSAIPTTIDVFSIASNGVLTPISGSPFKPGVGFDSNVVLLGREDTRLFVTNQGSHTVTVFNAAPNGSLSLVQGSPFHDNGFPLQPSGMATNHAGTLLFSTNLIDTVSIFDIASDGRLAPALFSPFNLTVGNGNFLSLVAYPAKDCGPDFALGFNATQLTAERGTSLRLVVNVNRRGGFSGKVTVTPPDASAIKVKLKPPNPISTIEATVTFKAKIKGGAPTGPHELTFTGMDESGRTRTASLTLLIQ